ncbi:SDR family oxidoreductase [Rhizobium sp. FKY42]|uniref:SDR family oxidoreductase n=1 Tax=Rhizobium sp. FKY42 TaxID=2562310 RepID=UPI0010BFC17A|nr:SDR family oxidoreductase [Rhizobium sp. FKY42]
MTKVLVTGASGQLGRAVIIELLQQAKLAPSQIIAGSRELANLADLPAKGIETRRVDFNDPASMEAAFSGVDRVLIISSGELSTPSIRAQQHTAAVKAAVKAGVGHVLYTSMPNPDKSLISFAPDHLDTEAAIKASGLRYTILRNSWYIENYFMSLPQNLAVGTWYTSQGGGKLANISRQDCAAGAAAALASPPEGNAILTLTGPESLTVEQIAEIVSNTTGKPLAVVQINDEQLAGGMAEAGLPGFLVEMLVSTEANIRAGNFDLVSNDFERLTGRKPETVADFFEKNKAALG